MRSPRVSSTRGQRGLNQDEGATGRDRMKGAPSFDRRVPKSLLAALAPGGAFAWVSDLARPPVTWERPLDLGLRALASRPDEGHATLYLGTTQVLGVHAGKDGRFHLTSHQKNGLFADIDPPFDDAWSEWQPPELLGDRVPEIERHVEAAIRKAPPGRMVEGGYQAALSKPQAAGYVLVDREVMLSFAPGEKKDRIKEISRDLVKAQSFLKAEEYAWAANATPPGDKLDALAIDRDGRLLAIEVKPGSETNALGWAPVQVAMYARLVRAWTEADPEGARKVLEEMAHQRAALGLGSSAVPPLSDPIEVVPVIAVGKPIKNPSEARERFALIRDALRTHGEPLDGLRLWAVEKTLELAVTDATDLEELF